MLLSSKKIYPRCFCRQSSGRAFILSIPVVAFLFLVVTLLRQNNHIPRSLHIPRSDLQTLVESEAPDEDSSPIFLFVDEFRPKNWRVKKFDNEDARVIGFPVKGSAAKKNGSTKIIHLATPYFGKWNPRHFYFLHSGYVTFARYSCAIGDCLVTREPSEASRADAVLFHLRDLEVFSLPRQRSLNQTWILYSMEPPWLEVKDMRRFEGVFNWTMSYRRDSDILVRYGFIGRRPHARKEISRGIFQRKRNGAVWFVSNCRTDSNRERYIERLMRTYPVDVVGGCGKEVCRPAETGRCYVKVAEKYKFYLSFENAICRDYVTEKLFNPLEYDIIPVVFGGANYSRIAPKNSVINAMEFLSPEDLGQYLWKVSRNETLYLSYLTWKSTYRSYLQPWMCDLCEKLHAPQTSKARYDLEKWWHEDGSCLTWTTDGFVPVQKHAFPQYHVKLFDANFNAKD